MGLPYSAKHFIVAVHPLSRLITIAILPLRARHKLGVKLMIKMLIWVLLRPGNLVAVVIRMGFYIPTVLCYVL